MAISNYYYVAGNTAEGFVNFLPANVEGFKQIIILKHPSERLKTAVLNKLIKAYEGEYDLEVILSSVSEQYLEGVVIRGISKAVIVDTIASTDLEAAIELDLSLFMSNETVYPIDKEGFNHAYNSFAAGLRIHDDLEAIYVKEMDFKRADHVADQLINELLKNQSKKNHNAHVYHRLFGTNTTNGVVNIIPQLIRPLSNVYHLKGRAGTGKSTFMKKVLIACIAHGYDIQLYHCSFDPHSIDMVLVPELDFCIFDSTDPHEIEPKRAEEKVIDLYEETVTPGTDENYAHEIQKIHSNYKYYMKKGIRQLKEAGEVIEKHENQYSFSKNEVLKIVKFIIEYSFH